MIRSGAACRVRLVSGILASIGAAALLPAAVPAWAEQPAQAPGDPVLIWNDQTNKAI